MFLRKNENGIIIFPYNLSRLKKDFPSTSFSEPIDTAVLNQYGVHRVVPLNRPKDPDNVHYYTVGTPYQDSDETWVVGFIQNQRLQADAEASIREKREKLLVASDWTQMPDSPLSGEKKTEWATYRQSLRDVSSQEGFPYNVTWPTKPE